MDIFQEFATDELAEVEGAWFPLDKTSRVKVARANNTAYLKVLRQRLDNTTVDLDGTTKADEAAAQELFISIMAETILLGWEGLSFKGTDLPYSAANAVTLLNVKDFRKKVSGFSESFDAFRAKAETALGNA